MNEHIKRTKDNYSQLRNKRMVSVKDTERILEN